MADIKGGGPSRGFMTEEMAKLGTIRKTITACQIQFAACLLSQRLMKYGWAENRMADFNLWATRFELYKNHNRRSDTQTRTLLHNLILNLLLGLEKGLKFCIDCAILPDDSKGQTKEVQDGLNSSKSNIDLFLDALIRLNTVMQQYRASSVNDDSDTGESSDSLNDSDDSDDDEVPPTQDLSRRAAKITDSQTKWRQQIADHPGPWPCFVQNCSNNQAMYTSFEVLVGHIDVCHSWDSYWRCFACSQNPQAFKTENHFILHVQNCHEDIISSNLVKNIAKSCQQNGSPLRNCPLCDWARKFALVEHIMDKHTRKDIGSGLSGSENPTMLAFLANLRLHMTTGHEMKPEDMEFITNSVCPGCGKSQLLNRVRNQKALLDHILQHAQSISMDLVLQSKIIKDADIPMELRHEVAEDVTSLNEQDESKSIDGELYEAMTGLGNNEEEDTESIWTEPEPRIPDYIPRRDIEGSLSKSFSARRSRTVLIGPRNSGKTETVTRWVNRIKNQSPTVGISWIDVDGPLVRDRSLQLKPPVWSIHDFNSITPHTVVDYFFDMVNSETEHEWLLVVNIMVDFPNTVSLQMLTDLFRPESRISVIYILRADDTDHDSLQQMNPAWNIISMLPMDLGEAHKLFFKYFEADERAKAYEASKYSVIHLCQAVGYWPGSIIRAVNYIMEGPKDITLESWVAHFRGPPENHLFQKPAMRMSPYQLLNEISVERPAALSLLYVMSLAVEPEIRFNALGSYYPNGANDVMGLHKDLSVLSGERLIVYSIGGLSSPDLGSAIAWTCSVCRQGSKSCVTESRCWNCNHAICKDCATRSSRYNEVEVKLLASTASMDVHMKAMVRQWFKENTKQLRAVSRVCSFEDDGELQSAETRLFEQNSRFSDLHQVSKSSDHWIRPSRSWSSSSQISKANSGDAELKPDHLHGTK